MILTLRAGFGKRNTNNAFVVACNKFVYFDALPTAPEEPEEVNNPTPEAVPKPLLPKVIQPPTSPRPQRAQAAPTHPQPQPSASSSRPSPPVPFTRNTRRHLDPPALAGITAAITMSSVYEDDYGNLGELGLKLPRISPDLVPRNYGYERLRDFVQASGIVEV